MRLIRRRPLLRAAAVGGRAYYTGKRRMEARQREAGERARTAEVESRQAGARAPAAPEPGSSHDTIERLKQLAELHEQGALTDEEFATQKERLLGD